MKALLAFETSVSTHPTTRRHLLEDLNPRLWFISRSGFNLLFIITELNSRSQWPRGLRRRSAAARLLRSWVRIPPEAWMFVCCDCCVLSGRGICDELITRPEESYRLWCVVVCDLETSKMRRPWPTLGRSAKENKQNKLRSIAPRSLVFLEQLIVNNWSKTCSILWDLRYFGASTEFLLACILF